ncbi:MAG: hypothetical protein DHS20C19_19100 [Acidimicrobiales bacterium]|nr:MAG: hypothetical protein DHS20C19_19100 [Acidimicrobiales bacterium]
MSLITAQDGDVGALENEVLDEWELPVGEWVDQIVKWVDQNLGDTDDAWFDLLGAIKWPFEFLFTTFVRDGSTHHPWWELTDMPWWGVCGIFFVIGTLFRNAKIGLFAAGSLALCGLLGTEYWDEVSLTLGLIIVAVLLCALIGIPLGVLAGRMDPVWEALRPILDAMQVVHSFVYMLPFIFFFSIGEESATMVTMVFAIPPLIRLTNLGIRQVPDDVVEAARAYGAPEWRVLFDVQLPLARQAIMTGLNQTLLLSVSMLGIAAIMGAGGLGQLVFRAVQNQDVALGASSGLALFVVAVVLDRISQTQANDGMNLLGRIAQAWTARKNPELLLAQEEQAEKTGERADSGSSMAPAEAPEVQGAMIASVGAVIAAVAVFLTWGKDAGLLSGYSRRGDDTDLVGETFAGWSAEGGSWFGLIVLGLALTVILAVGVTRWRPGTTGRWLGPDGAVLFSVTMLVVSIGYLVTSPSILADAAGYEHGIGVYVAIIGSAIAVAGSVRWLAVAPFAADRPLPARVNWGRLAVAAFCVVWAIAASFSAWTSDERADTVLTPEDEARIAEIREQVAAGDLPGAEGAAEIVAISSSARQDRLVYDAWHSDGPGYGTYLLILAGIGLVASVPASGLVRLDEPYRWRWSVVTAGVGLGITSLTLAFVVSILRTADPRFSTGAGCLLALVVGFVFIVTSRNVLAEFRRAKVFSGDREYHEAAAEPADPAAGAPVPARA